MFINVKQNGKRSQESPPTDLHLIIFKRALIALVAKKADATDETRTR